MNKIVYSLWIGNQLPRLQRLAIQTWLVRGYDYRLFYYGKVPGGTPREATTIDGSKFMPEIYRYTWPREREGHTALHANLFRYAWLYEYGGTWIDADTLLLRELPQDPFIVSTEPSKNHPGWTPDVVLMRVPPKSELLKRCHELAQHRIEVGSRTWGEFGPSLLKECLEELGMLSLDYLAPPRHYCPVPCWVAELLYKPHALDIPKNAYTVHVWQTKSTEKGFDLNREYEPESLYERLWRVER